MDLPAKECDEEEIFCTKERDDLKEVVPLANEIHKLRRQLDMDRREFEEDDLCGPEAVPERTEERDNLLAMLNKKSNLET